jgi:hypothetical protein
MNIFKRFVIRISRWRHSKGFGVQSPWAYRFIRYVVRERYPYYSYDDFSDYLNGMSCEKRSRFKLYFRIANYLQPSTIVDLNPQSDLYFKFFHAGCSTSNYVVLRDAKQCNELQNIDLLRISLSGDYRSFLNSVLGNINENSVIILEDIYRDKETKIFWKELINDKKVGNVFDLYYLGIIFFDLKRYKNIYYVNF